MEEQFIISKSMVSVIIPCYNHGNYLQVAIESVINQSYKDFEIIVVDDGSTDNTKSVCNKYSNVKYIYQNNSGLSSARNTGIKHSKGAFLVFLDADDWLFENALKINLDLLMIEKNIAFVSGGHQVFYEDTRHTKIVQEEVNENHYCRFLEGNYIGMHATVMYQRWIFDTFMFDTSLPYCEDYDLYLKIARVHSVLHHTSLIAVYRMHSTNMSSNYPIMLKYTLAVLLNQNQFLQTSKEKESSNNGISIWKNYYSFIIYQHLQVQLYTKKSNLYRTEMKTLMINDPILFEKFQTEKRQSIIYKRQLFKTNIISKLKKVVKKIIPEKMLKSIQKISNAQSKSTLSGKVDLGDFNRTTPFSTQFGYDRGGPVDRYYIENFLNENASLIKGRVLEIGDNEYTLRFGGDKIEKSDILHIDDSNKQATFIGDLSNAPHLPSDNFDCIVLTQTLHLIYDYKAAIETCHRVLKSGGTLLLTVPGISHIAQDEWRKYWLWSFTNASIEKIIGEHFSTGKISIKTHGNVLVASAFLYGMGLPEMRKEQMDYHDPHYQVIITVNATK